MTPRRWIALALVPVLQVACHEGGIDEASQRLVSVEASATACGRNELGTIRCWANVNAALGSPVRDAPILVPRGGQPELVSVQESGGGCGVDRRGQGWCWGPNAYGQAGTGRASPSEPVSQVDSDLRFDAIGVSYATRCGLARDQVIYCWGGPVLAGRPGLPTDTCQSPDDPDVQWPCVLSPQPIVAPAGFTSFDMGEYIACGLLEGAAWCWSDYTESQTPRAVPGLPALTSLSADGERACGVSSGGEVWCWDTFSGGDPARVDLPDAAPATLVSVGAQHSCALARDGRAFCWGYGLATGSLQGRSATPVEPLGRLRFTDLAAGHGFTCGITPEGAWCWGDVVGDGSGQPSVLPARVSGQGDLDS